MHKIDELGEITLEFLKKEFPQDHIYPTLYSNGTSIYVNNVCYVSTDRNSTILRAVKYGVADMKDYTREFNAADPDFFDKVKKIVQYNINFFGRSKKWL